LANPKAIGSVTSSRRRKPTPKALVSFHFGVMVPGAVFVFDQPIMKRLLCLFAALSFGTLTMSFVQAAPPPPFILPTGDWAVDANGSHGTLHIAGVDALGNLQAGSTIFNNPIFGSYDSTAARISFIRLGDGPSFQQIYTGYLFEEPVSIPLVFNYVLTGEFQAYAGSGVPAERSVLGWYATRTIRIIITAPTDSGPSASTSP
jgi:hypothetical protein